MPKLLDFFVACYQKRGTLYERARDVCKTYCEMCTAFQEVMDERDLPWRKCPPPPLRPRTVLERTYRTGEDTVLERTQKVLRLLGPDSEPGAYYNSLTRKKFK